MRNRFLIWLCRIFLFTFVLFFVIFLKSDQEANKELLNNQNSQLFLEESKKAGSFILGAKKEEKTASIVFVGDIMLSRDVDAKMRVRQDYFYPFRETTDFLAGVDIAFGNLENPIIAGRPIKTEEMIFRSDPKVASFLKKAGFDILSLANNHTLNFGEKGLLNTFKYLKEQGIGYIGAGNNFEEAYKPIIKEINGIRIGFLAYTYPEEYKNNFSGIEPQLAFLDKEKMIQNVAVLKPRVDFLIISMHAGTEYASTANFSQIEFAHAAIDAGVSMVIGHHPHVVQNAEIYKGKYIFYSLGNFIFDQMWSKETTESLVLKAVVSKNGLKEITFHSVKIFDYCQPKFLNEKEGEYILKRLKLE